MISEVYILAILCSLFS